jgi:hypothetical protein
MEPRCKEVDRQARFRCAIHFGVSDMGLFSKDIKTMDDMLLHGLQDIYYAEQQITKAFCPRCSTRRPTAI